jgi:gluconokinase
MVIVLMGVSGSGKSTVGKVLAEQLGWKFLDADDFHPPENVEKMRAGRPLTDKDRKPWLKKLRERAAVACRIDEQIVLACSALKHSYQEYLENHDPDCVHFVHLVGSPELIKERLEERKGHFMNPSLLESQFEALEPPENSLQIDVTPPPEEIAREIRQKLGLP